MNGPVLLFTVLVSCAACVLFGVLPAIAAVRPEIHGMLRQAGQQSATPGGRKLSTLVLGAEVACSMVLVVTAALLISSFRHVLNVPIGFEPQNVLIVRTSFNGERYASPAKRRQAERRNRRKWR